MEDVLLVTPAVVVKPIDDEVEKARTTRTDDVLPPKRSVVSIADGMVIFILTYTTIVVEWVALIGLVVAVADGVVGEMRSGQRGGRGSASVPPPKVK